MTLLQNLIGQLVEKSSTHAGVSVDIPEEATKSRTARLIYQIRQRPGISTAELARASGLHSSLVWGLLKHATRTGQIEHSVQSGWRMSSVRDDQQIAAAAEFLRLRGWTCEPPEASKAA